ncbi:MAG: hypothetical protein LBB51_01880, partial [Zoogloeaceae bacterium]|nr:hypothetical protein [Zoogloeaceae bacterium]
MKKPLEALGSLSAAAVFVLFSGSALAATVQLTPDADNTFDEREFSVEVSLPSEGWHYGNNGSGAWVWTAGEIDLGLSGYVNSVYDSSSNRYSTFFSLASRLGYNDSLYPERMATDVSY